LTDTDYKKNINTSIDDDKIKYKYQKPKTDIIEESKILINKAKGETDKIASDFNKFLGDFNDKFEFEKAIKSDLPITNLSDISDLSGDGVLLYGNGISNNTINKIMSNFK
jgi:hypothetical protein